MACGVPVVVSSHESLDEASGRRRRARGPRGSSCVRRCHRARAGGARAARRARPRARRAVLLARRRRDLPPRVRGGSAMRGDQEIVVVVRRGPEFLVMRRSPERLGYWSLVAGGVEPDETPHEAARARALRGDRARGEGARSRSRCRTRCSTTRPRSAPATRPGSRRSPCTRSSPTRREVGADARRRARRLRVVRPRRGARACSPTTPRKDAVRAAAKELR